MDVFVKMIGSVAAQNLLGWLIIIIILAVFIVGIIFNQKIKRYYTSLNKDIKASINTEKKEVYFESEELNNIVKRFKKSTESGTDNINTQVIIEKNLSDKYISLEGVLKLLPAILIALGLLGTFLGLTLAIFDTKVALGGIASIDKFTKEMQGPISSMATAFWTSIFGVALSTILNLISNSYKNSKNTFYNEIEDYLDNEIFADHAKTFNTIFEEFSKTVKLTMLTLTEEMTNLFKDGVEELVSKINTSSIDLTESAKGLAQYTKEFKSLVKTFDNTVHSFEAPVAAFNKSVSEFVVTSDNLSESVDSGFENFVHSSKELEKSMSVLSSNIDDSFEAMSRSMDMSLDNLSANLGQCFTGITREFEGTMTNLRENLDDGLIRISNAMVTNAQSTLEAAATMKEESNNLTENQENIKDIIDEVKRSNKQSSEQIISQGQILKRQSKKLEEVLEDFSKSSEHIPIHVAEKFSYVLKDYLDDVGINIKTHLDESIGTIKTDILGVSKSLDETINVIDNSRDIINSTTRRNNYRRKNE